MKKSLPQAILTLLVVGLTFTALSDRASARGGGGGGSRGGSYGGSFSSRSSYSYSRPEFVQQLPPEFKVFQQQPSLASASGRFQFLLGV